MSYKPLADRSPQREENSMSAAKMIGIGLGVLAAVAVAANLKDLARYIKIASM